MKTLYQLMYDWKMGRMRRREEKTAGGQWNIMKKPWPLDMRNIGVCECSFYKNDRRKIHFTYVKWWAYLWADPSPIFLMEYVVKSESSGILGYRTKSCDLPPTSLRKTLKYCESMLRLEGEE